MIHPLVPYYQLLQYNNYVQEIAALEAALQETKAAGAAATTELKQLVEDNTADTGALDIQAAQLSEVNGQIDELNAKIQEVLQKIATAAAENATDEVVVESENDSSE